jgi:hypothetical protein
MRTDGLFQQQLLEVFLLESTNYVAVRRAGCQREYRRRTQ